MNKELLELINLYADGELDRKDEVSLFVLLSQNEEARQYFKNLQLLKTGIAQSVEEMPGHLEERIIKSVVNGKTENIYLSEKKSFSSRLSYAFAVILLILCTYIFLKFDNYQTKFETISNQLQIQNETIELLYNSMPAVEVTGQLKNKIIITSKL